MNKDFEKFEDFIFDDSFMEFVENTSEESVTFWNNWKKEHPEKEKEVQKAVEVLHLLTRSNKSPVKEDKNKALTTLLSAIEKSESHSRAFTHWAIKIGKIAALLVFIAGLGWGWLTAYRMKMQNKNSLSSEIIVPIGEKAQMVLPDGSHVWINSGSVLRYSPDFGKNNRELMLEGEAYFDVTKRKTRFVVNTRDVSIKVLGTAFNVKAYPNEEKTQTTVVRGIVRVESKQKGIKPVILLPAQMAILKTEENAGDIDNTKGIDKTMRVINEVNTSITTSWKDQLLVFADETFEDIAVKIERWYNVKIRIENEELKKERYTGKFVNNETVYQVLEAIKITTPINYVLKDKEIIITK